MKIHKLGKELSVQDIREIYNDFSKGKYCPSAKEIKEELLTGQHCNCPAGEGEFVLLPANDPSVIEGGKRYMVCIRCGQYSHL